MANGNGEKKADKPKWRRTGGGYFGVKRDGTPDLRWSNVGAAWEAFSQRDGSAYIAIRLDSIPVNFDGTLALHENDEIVQE